MASNALGWPLSIAARPVEETSWSRADGFAIVLYERDAFPECWAEDLARLSSESPRPWIILLSATTDSNLREELARCGGSDILRMPVCPDAVVHAVQRGLPVWRTRQALRGKVAPAPAVPPEQSLRKRLADAARRILTIERLRRQRPSVSREM